MRGKHKTAVLFGLAFIILILPVLPPSPARAGEGISEINDLWRDFAAAVRRGDYQAAYLMFSEQSRSVFPFRDFVVEYSPLSAARETLLGEPTSLSTDIDGDWAEMRFAVSLPISGQQLRVGASFARNDETWRLVAARNLSRERIEAAARDTLRRLAAFAKDADAGGIVAEIVRREISPGPLGTVYDFGVWDGVLRALPKGGGMRAFHLDDWGRVRQGRGGRGAIEPLREMRPAASVRPDGPAPTRPAPTRPARDAAKSAPTPGTGNVSLPELSDPSESPSESLRDAFPDPGPLGDPVLLPGPLLPPPELADPAASEPVPADARTMPQKAPVYPNLPDRIF